MPLVDLLLALSVPVMWGLGLTVAKAAISADFPPILLMALRFALAGAVLVWFVRPPPARLMGRIFLITVLGATIQYSLTFTGLKGLDASTAGIVIQLEVPFAAALAALLLKDRLGWRRTLGMAVAFAGVAVIAGEPRFQGDLAPLLMVVGGAFTWSLAQVAIKTLGRVGGFTLVAWTAVFAAPQLFVASWLFEDGQVAAITHAGTLVWSAVVYLGVIMTGLGYAVWYHLLGRHRVNQVMPFLLLLPLVTAVSGVLLLGERLSVATLAGGALVIAGVAVIVLTRGPTRAPLPAPD